MSIDSLQKIKDEIRKDTRLISNLKEEREGFKPHSSLVLIVMKLCVFSLMLFLASIIAKHIVTEKDLIKAQLESSNLALIGDTFGEKIFLKLGEIRTLETHLENKNEVPFAKMPLRKKVIDQFNLELNIIFTINFMLYGISFILLCHVVLKTYIEFMIDEINRYLIKTKFKNFLYKQNLKEKNIQKNTVNTITNILHAYPELSKLKKEKMGPIEIFIFIEKAILFIENKKTEKNKIREKEENKQKIKIKTNKEIETTDNLEKINNLFNGKNNEFSDKNKNLKIEKIFTAISEYKGQTTTIDIFNRYFQIISKPKITFIQKTDKIAFDALLCQLKNLIINTYEIFIDHDSINYNYESFNTYDNIDQITNLLNALEKY